jgi:hypothetical protein
VNSFIWPTIKRGKLELASCPPLKFSSTTEKTPVPSTDGVKNVQLTPGDTYELFYWNGAWASLGKQTASDKSVTFSSKGFNCLYWLVKDGGNKDERIFSYDLDGNLTWW